MACSTHGAGWCGCGGRIGRVGCRDMVFAGDQHPHAAPLSRPADHRTRVARGAAAGIFRHDRAPRAARVSRPPRRAAESGLRARPHVYVAVRDLRLDPAAGSDPGIVGVGPPGAGVTGRFRRADGAHVDLAARRGARRRRAGRGGQSPGAAPVRPRPRRRRPARRCG